MRKTLGLLAACAIGAIGLGCSDTSGAGTGLLTVRLTDAPFPFSDVADVDVYVVRVDAKQAPSTDEDAADESSEGWTSIATPNALINLLDLGSGKTVNLGAATLPTGTYQSFRLILDTDKSSITLKDGTKPPIFFPSAAHSGIKVILDQPISLTENGSVTTFDFDIGRSFVMRGNKARFVPTNTAFKLSLDDSEISPNVGDVTDTRFAFSTFVRPSNQNFALPTSTASDL